jgi:hypothetical protein
MNIQFPFWQELRKLLVDMGDGTHAERVEAYPPKSLLTESKSRLLVEPGQSGFFEGRYFRTFQKLEVPSGQSRTIRATVPNDIILFETSFSTENATIEVQLRVGGTVVGPWIPMPVLRKNTTARSPVLTNQVTLDYDGAHTGGAVIDLIRIPAENKSSNVSGDSSARGVGPGVYYYSISNQGNQTATVVFNGFWEELP